VHFKELEKLPYLAKKTTLKNNKARLDLYSGLSN